MKRLQLKDGATTSCAVAGPFVLTFGITAVPCPCADPAPTSPVRFGFCGGIDYRVVLDVAVQRLYERNRL